MRTDGPPPIVPHVVKTRPPRLRQRLRRRVEPPHADWHALSIDEARAELSASIEGLDPEEAYARLRRFGANALEPPHARSRLAILGGQLLNVPSALLLGSSAVSAALGELLDAGAILSVVGLNTTIGYVVERTNEKLIASWRRAEAGEARVLRGGEELRVSTAELVPGDILF